MKYFLLSIAIFVASCLVIGWSYLDQSNYAISDREKAVNEALGHSIKFLKDKYCLRIFGTTVAMPGGDIQYLALEFQKQGPLTKTEIRKLLIDIAHDFLKDLNSDVNLCSFLKTGSLNIYEIGVILFFVDGCGRGLEYPEISIGEISRGIMEYSTYQTGDDNFRKIKSMEKESYAEAILILRSQYENVAEF